MQRANDIQVGGNHYKKSKYEHWDWAVNCGLDYLASAASKYVFRWRDKNGMQDLEKARHYVMKLIEVSPLVLTRHLHTRPPRPYIIHETTKFIRENHIELDAEITIYDLLAIWETREHLEEVIAQIDTLIEHLKYHHAMEQGKAAKPVPLEDSNKHAERA